MTRFEMEINGIIDAQIAEREGEPNNHFWENNAKQEVALAVAHADRDATVDENGAIRWKSNGHYIPDDFCEKLEWGGYNFSREATRKAREEEEAKFFEKMRGTKRVRSEEEMAELRANFPKGTVIVDVITGEMLTI